jgi:hypothetical protein
MHAPRLERFAAACGIIFVLLFFAGLLLQDTGASSHDVSPAEVVAHYSDGDNELRREIGATLVGFAVFFLLLFLGSLRRALQRAEGERGVFTSAAYAGGVVMAAFLGISAALATAVASAEGFYDNYDVEANTALTFSTLSLWALGLASVGGAVLVGSASLVAWKTGLFPKWLAIAAFVAAALGFFGETTAAFGVGYVVTLAWLLVASVILVKRGPGVSEARSDVTAALN